ncbi:hypothetical protein CAEBREN_21951 [Caenorhabditis brenneri]|uniref:Uncharacterized protein n=1 Tax=Caenorhabditis brenneri TaxID=135651 RepID=G0MBV5_CAEBE|nr:hypothetical protein CAEBREN_21951 [Caenorhabditis brenneri]
MSKDIVPSTPDTLPIFIAGKLEALDWDTKDADLNEIRLLLYTYQEERMISDEELQEWKKSEKKILENQNNYKKITKRMEEDAKYFLPLGMIITMLIKFGFKILQYILQVEFPKEFLSVWSIMDFIVVAIYLSYFHGSDLRLKFLTAKPPVQPEVLENEDDDWENSMTSTELQSTQKTVLNEWRQLRKERKEYVESSFLMSFVHCVIIFYCFIRLFAIKIVTLDESIKFFSCSTSLEKLFLCVEYIFTVIILTLFLLQKNLWRKKSNEDENSNKKSN